MLLFATLAFSVPAAASIAHEADHRPAVELHFHLGNFASQPGDVDGDQADKQGIGHNHAPFSATDPALLSAETLALMKHASETPQDWSVKELNTLSWTPQKRPPRA